MTATDSFIISAAHPRSHVGSSGQQSRQTAALPPDVRHSFFARITLPSSSRKCLRYSSRVRARRFPPVLGERQHSKAFLTSKMKNIMANFETRF